jgi:hypothetical protein
MIPDRSAADDWKMGFTVRPRKPRSTRARSPEVWCVASCFLKRCARVIRVDIASRLQEWQSAGDERLWRIIVSPEFGDWLDLPRLTRELIKRMEQGDWECPVFALCSSPVLNGAQTEHTGLWPTAELDRWRPVSRRHLARMFVAHVLATFASRVAPDLVCDSPSVTRITIRLVFLAVCRKSEKFGKTAADTRRLEMISSRTLR